MKVLKIIAIVLMLLVAGIYGGSFLAPSEYGMERSTVINAPAEVIFSILDDYQKWPQWSPWASEDPEMKVTYGSTTTGVGASYSWEGPKTGKGKMVTTESVPSSKHVASLDFEGSVAVSGFYLTPEGSGTKVVWDFKGKAAGAMDRYFGLFIEKLLSPSYEKGLAQLKTVAEAEAAKTPEIPVQEVADTLKVKE